MSEPQRHEWRLDQSGLTLLEVVVTLIILSMMGLLATEALRLGRRSWEKQQIQVDAEQRIRVIYATLAQEVAALQPVTELVEEKRVIAFEGLADRLLFYARPDRYQPFPYNAMVRSLSFSVDQEKGLIMLESYPLLADESARSAVRVVDPKVSRVAFRYLPPSAEGLRDFNWVERWVPKEFVQALGQRERRAPASQRVRERGSSDEENGLPLAVEVSVTISVERGEKNFTFLFPIHVGGYLHARLDQRGWR